MEFTLVFYVTPLVCLPESRSQPVRLPESRFQPARLPVSRSPQQYP